MKRTLFVVSDIHGHYTLLKNALDKAGFDKEDPNHLLVCCGDYFDRGSENVAVLKFFERLKHCVLLRGNHEDMLLKLLYTGKVLPHHYINGTMQTMTDFFGKFSIDPADDTVDFSGKTSNINWLCEFIESTQDYFETEHYVFVHGWLPDGDYRTADKESWEKARWIKWIHAYTGQPPIPEKTLVCGHYPTFFAETHCGKGNADIFRGNGLIAIDAGTYSSGQVNVLVLEDEV